MPATDAIQAYTVVLLRCGSFYLLLQRGQERQYAPGRWTGVGGHVEPHEYHQLKRAALREVEEEAGFLPDVITNFVLRRTLLVTRPDQSIGVLLYYTGELPEMTTPDCPEGTLAWKQAAEFDHLDIIETTRPVFDCLISDLARDPEGRELPKMGLAVFNPQGQFLRAVWGE